jgi:hypothetical protein
MATVRAYGAQSAARICRGLQDEVIAASSSPLRDDATILVLALGAADPGTAPPGGG